MPQPSPGVLIAAARRSRPGRAVYAALARLGLVLGWLGIGGFRKRALA